MKISVIVVLALLLTSSFSFQSDAIRFDIQGNPVCLKSLRKYQFTLVLPKNLEKMKYVITAMNSSVTISGALPNRFEVTAGYPGLSYFVISKYSSKTKKYKQVKKIEYKICK